MREGKTFPFKFTRWHCISDFVLQRWTSCYRERRQFPACSATPHGGLLQRQPSQRNGKYLFACSLSILMIIFAIRLNGMRICLLHCPIRNRSPSRERFLSLVVSVLLFKCINVKYSICIHVWLIFSQTKYMLMFSSINFSRPIIVASLKLLRDFLYTIMIDVIYSKIQSYFYRIS